MLQCFLISREKGGMEDGVNLPPRGDVEAEGHAGDNFLDFEGTSSFHLKLLGAVHVEVCRFEPDPISHLPRSEFGGYLFFHLLLGDLMGGLGIVTGSRQVQESAF